ncbi:hypothetical protein K8353_27830 [Burkholderia contaminans]|nr:hypothetical protein [Burkholderia contaminans]
MHACERVDAADSDGAHPMEQETPAQILLEPNNAYAAHPYAFHDRLFYRATPRR